MSKQTVKVVVRVKPNESQDLCDDTVTVISDPQNSAIMLKKNSSDAGLYQFNFNRAVRDVSQQELYEMVGQEVVNNVLEGYNGTIMAYGQTGSGKTYTMTGPENVSLTDAQMQGVMPRAMREIFYCILKSRVPLWTVHMTYLEIYNETFKDLLAAESKDIILQESRKGVITLKNVQNIQVESFEEALRYLHKAQKQRAVAGHDMNTRSSRSHTILTLWIQLTNEDGQTCKSKLNMVDLAGSERAGKTGAKGKSLREATHINKSLTFLEQVIVALSSRRDQHVPYRSSKLTHYLKDSIGGNCKTTLVACCWGNREQLNETLSTCRFADRMSKIHVTANKNNGLNSIHGSLFKLDPKMQSYLEQTTAAAVAREKAKLIAHLRKKGQLLEDANIDFDDECDSEKHFAESERQELESLREKVKELEQMDRDISAHKGAEIVDEATAAEIEELRKKILEMELERQHELMERQSALQNLDINSPQCNQLESLRQRVQELRQQEQLSVQELVELQELRTQVIRLQELQTSYGLVPIKNETSEELEYLQERMKVIQSNISSKPADSVSESDVQELVEVRSRLEQLYNEATTPTPTTTSVNSLVYQNSQHERNTTQSCSDNFSQHWSQQFQQQTEMQQITQQFAHLQQTIEDLKQQIQVRSQIQDIPIINAPSFQIPDSASQVFTEQQTYRPSLSINGNDQHSFSLMDCESQHKKKKKFPKMLRKIFGKKKKPNTQFGDPYQTASQLTEDQGQNIVILNSLTHAQLMELLKAHNLSGQSLSGLTPMPSDDKCQETNYLSDQVLQELQLQNRQPLQQQQTQKSITLQDLQTQEALSNPYIAQSSVITAPFEQQSVTGSKLTNENETCYKGIQIDEYKVKFKENPLQISQKSQNQFIQDEQEQDSSPGSGVTPNGISSIDEQISQQVLQEQTINVNL
eukprot:TRINITY_DN20933_c0_g1_i2.p1 TRINITY_DN20933_c0_g1~~TRINITY_DN20933_c0_g1_i2.p1  ORF type:complete len:926 (+),score=77.13 TRINITY_DN20933_c0_g1_i2:189-2966(+)